MHGPKKTVKNQSSMHKLQGSSRQCRKRGRGEGKKPQNPPPPFPWNSPPPPVLPPPRCQTATEGRQSAQGQEEVLNVHRFNCIGLNTLHEVFARGVLPMPMASPEAPPSMEAAFTSKASSRTLPGCALEPPALCTPALMVAKPTCNPHLHGLYHAGASAVSIQPDSLFLSVLAADPTAMLHQHAS